MSNDKTVRTLLRYETDRGSTQQTINSIQQITSQNARLSNEMSDVEEQARKVKRELPRAFDDSKVEDVTKSVDSLNKKLKETEEQAKRASRNLPGSGGVRNNSDGLLAAAETGRRQATRRGVGTLGDIDTALSTVASATGQRGLVGAADVFAVAEQFELLRGAAQAALPQLAAAAGPVGLGAIAVGAAAFAVTAVVLGGALQDANEDAKNYAIQLDAERAAREEAADLTTEETRAAIAAKNATIERTRAEIALLEAQQQGSTEFERNISRWTGVGSRAVERANDVAELEAKLVAAESAIVGYTISIIDGTAAANDAAEAERMLAEERQKSAVAEINRTAQIRQFELSARDGTVEAAQTQFETFQAQIPILQDQIAALEAVGEDTTALTNQLLLLEAQSVSLQNSIIPTLQAQEALVTAQEDLAAAQAEAAAASGRYADSLEITAQGEIARADALLQAEQDLSNAQVQIAEQTVERAQNALDKLNDSLANLQRDFARDAADAVADARAQSFDQQLELQRDLLTLERDTAREILDIRRRAQQQEADLIGNRDFAGLERLRRTTEQEINEARRAEQEARGETARQFNEANQDAARQFERERADRLQAFNRAQADAQDTYNAQLSDARSFYETQRQVAIESYARIIDDIEAEFARALQASDNALLTDSRRTSQNSRQLLQRASEARGFQAATPQALGFNAIQSTNNTANIPININGAQNPAQLGVQLAQILSGVFGN